MSAAGRWPRIADARRSSATFERSTRSRHSRGLSGRGMRAPLSPAVSSAVLMAVRRRPVSSDRQSGDA